MQNERAFADYEREMYYLTLARRYTDKHGEQWWEFGGAKLEQIAEWGRGEYQYDPFGGSGFGAPASDDFTVQPGAIAVLWGRGLGYPIRGVAVRNPGDETFTVLFYRTEEEQREKNRHEIAAMNARQRADFEANVATHDANYEALPDIFKQRIDRFRAEEPDFRWKSEAYEVFCLSQAVVFADTLQSEQAVREFYDLPYEEQRQRVPGMSDQHSGYTFGAACKLAIALLKHRAGESVNV